MLYKIEKARMNELFTAVSAREKLYLPSDNERGEAVYTEYKEGVTLSHQLNTLRSAKDFFFPQVQQMVGFRREGKHIEVIDPRQEAEDYVIFGCRACDARSFDILDRVFLADPVDTAYETKRKHATVITLACTKPDGTCFCAAFGIDAAKPAGDARAWIEKDLLYLEPLTEKGTAFVTANNDLLTEADETDEKAVEQQVQRTHEIFEKLPLHDLKPVDNREKELELFNLPVWKELSSHCLGCGSCTFVCPTCQCFDIEDFTGNDTIERYRCWDSCMYNDFTMMAAGTPRKTQMERFRQRFMHKLVYYPIKNDGIYSCVGCGRCLRKCPIHMNIVKVMRALEEVKE